MQRTSWEVEEFKHCCVLVSVQGEWGFEPGWLQVLLFLFMDSH